jgi:hypothetical protein
VTLYKGNVEVRTVAKAVKYNFIFTLKMEAIRSSEKLLTTHNITLRYNPENHNPNVHCCGKLES